VGLSLSTAAPGATRKVGKGKNYPTPCAAIQAAADGDTILIDAGNYPGDVCALGRSRLTLKSVGGRARIDAQGKISQGKAIWVIAGNDTTVEGIEFSGAAAEARNGAGIRLDGRNLTVRDCYFHHNENGILTGNNGGRVLVEFSEFADNGAGDGYSHNMYIGSIDSFTLRYSYSHRAVAGHLVKSRAAVNVVEYNRLTDETGTASYELDFPNGGLAYVVGNYLQQGANASNPNVLAYLMEGANPRVTGRSLYVVNNTFVNQGRYGLAVMVYERLTSTVVLRNNLIAGFVEPITSARVDAANNIAVRSVEQARFVDAAGYDFRLQANSPAVDAGRPVSDVNGVSLTAVSGFVTPHCRVERSVVGNSIDAGADEFGNRPSAPVCNGSGAAGH
jgi:hypothetical protein